MNPSTSYHSTSNPSTQTYPPTTKHKCGPTCNENLFKDITKSLEANSYTEITEDTSRKWDDKDPNDPSGDRTDLIGWMDELQKTCRVGTFPRELGAIEKILLDQLLQLAYTVVHKDQLNLVVESSFGFVKKEDGIWKMDDPAHQVILLDVTITKKDAKGNSYSFTVLDPNGPHIRQIDCAPDGNLNLPICEFKSESGKSDYPSKGIMIMQESSYKLVRTLDNNNRNKIKDCLKDKWDGTNPTPGFCCRSGLIKGSKKGLTCTGKERYADWLKGNYMDIGNKELGKNDDTIKGGCGGWARVHILMTYMGDFIGECPKKGKDEVADTSPYPCDTPISTTFTSTYSSTYPSTYAPTTSAPGTSSFTTQPSSTDYTTPTTEYIPEDTFPPYPSVIWE